MTIKNAYMIMAHHNFEQLSLLLSLLDDVDNDLFIHIDSKAGLVDESAFARKVKSSKVEFLPRMSITWGGVSQLQCELALLNIATCTHHDYYHLLSGDDLPIKTNAQIAAFLEKNYGKEFVGIKMLGKPEELPSYISERVSLFHPLQDKLPAGGRKKSIGKCFELIALTVQRIVKVDRLRGRDILLGKGPQWFSVTEGLARYMLNYKDYGLDFFDSYLCGDEIFPQTVIANSPYMDNIWRGLQEDDNAASLRLIDWERGFPWTWRADDFDTIRTSDCLFARKFDAGVDEEIIKRVVELVRE